MTVTFHPRTTGAKLRRLVPPAYREGVAAATRPGGSHALLLFAHAPRDVVPSPPVRKSLRRPGDPPVAGIVAVGTVFTAEALALLGDAGARAIVHRQAPGTDETARRRQD